MKSDSELNPQPHSTPDAQPISEFQHKKARLRKALLIVFLTLCLLELLQICGSKFGHEKIAPFHAAPSANLSADPVVEMPKEMRDLIERCNKGLAAPADSLSEKEVAEVRAACRRVHRGPED